MSFVHLVPVGLGAAAGAGLLHLPDLSVQRLESAATVLAGVDATLLGFLVSAGALIFAVGQTVLVRNLYRTGHLQRLLRALFVNAALFLMALVSALVCHFLPTPAALSPGTGFVYAAQAMVGFNVAALVALLPLGYTLFQLLIHLGPRDQVLEEQ